MNLEPVARTKNGNYLWREEGGDGPLLFVSGMSVDGDGSPHCYHPANTGLDYLANAHTGENWYGVVTSGGVPVVQGPSDPAPGYYVSPTSLCDPSIKNPANPLRYVDSERVPFIAFPGRLLAPHGGADIKRLALGVNLGDYVIIYDTKTGKYCGGLFADVGPSYKAGEASICVCQELGLSPSCRSGGVSDPHRIGYVIFPQTFNRWQASPWPQTPEQIRERAMTLFEEWGEGQGMQKLELVMNAIKSSRDDTTLAVDDA